MLGLATLLIIVAIRKSQRFTSLYHYEFESEGFLVKGFWPIEKIFIPYTSLVGWKEDFDRSIDDYNIEKDKSLLLISTTNGLFKIEEEKEGFNLALKYFETGFSDKLDIFLEYKQRKLFEFSLSKMLHRGIIVISTVLILLIGGFISGKSRNTNELYTFIGTLDYYEIHTGARSDPYMELKMREFPGFTFSIHHNLSYRYIRKYAIQNRRGMLEGRPFNSKEETSWGPIEISVYKSDYDWQTKNKVVRFLRYGGSFDVVQFRFNNKLVDIKEMEKLDRKKNKGFEYFHRN